MSNKVNQGLPSVCGDERLTMESTFQFECGPHVPCFTECCGKLELLLTPYDVLRLRRRLGISSEEFLDLYTTVKWNTGRTFPDMLMQMEPATGNRCPFVTDKGCSLYEDRPGACRIYPLGRASTTHPCDGGHREFYFTVREDHCKGFEETKTWKVKEWLADQGVEEYNRLNDLLMELFVLSTQKRRISLGPQHIQMYVMACFNGEKFRDFLFKSGFFGKFKVSMKEQESLRQDDVKLLEFAFRWLKFALFGQPTLSVRS